MFKRKSHQSILLRAKLQNTMRKTIHDTKNTTYMYRELKIYITIAQEDGHQKRHCIRPLYEKKITYKSSSSRAN